MTLFWSEDADTRVVLQRAVDRLARATGRADIAVSPDGIPVTFTPDVDYMGKEVCGLTNRTTRRALDIGINTTPPPGVCQTTEAVLEHELIHALYPTGEHTHVGLFAEKSNRTYWIDEMSLERLCEGFDCAAFEPEDPAFMPAP